MPVFKCKMCGGKLEINEASSIAVCEYCGSKQTLPKLDNEQKLNMYDRADHFRRNYEYDKAMSVYENIINEDNSDAEAYWSVVLCKYGIEYVEDPASHKRIPTINRAQYTSVLADENYKAAIKHADPFQREVYEEEAKYLDKIQKSILEISQKEEPYDIFICYKETDANGKRTRDSVLANDLYHGLTSEGFKVFFSRISLEDKLGSAYEPYIFAALNSAKAMIVLGTKPEYFNAVWVKNEWKRYLALIKTGEKKTLIPAYSGMDPYDLPEEFSHLQAQDMSKLGFMQDIIRGIKKIVVKDEPKVVKETVIVKNENGDKGNIQTLLKRMFSFLEDEDWEKATEYSERVLDIEPECVDAFIGGLMSYVGIVTRGDFYRLHKKFTPEQVDRLFNSPHYAKILRYGDKATVAEFKGYKQKYIDDVEDAKYEVKYEEACKLMISGITYENTDKIRKAQNCLKSLGKYKDSEEKANQCENIVKETDYHHAIETLHDKNADSSDLENAMYTLIELVDYKDSKEAAEKCRIRHQELLLIEEQERNKRKKKAKRVFITVVSIIIACALVGLIWFGIISPQIENKKALDKYNQALAYIEQNDFRSACKLFYELGDFEDSMEKYKEYQWQACEKGDTILFGNYEQDNNQNNGLETIEWIVLAKADNRVLIISKYCLDTVRYHSTYQDITRWEKCELREWMNGNFYTNAFTEEERERVFTATIDNNIDITSWEGKQPHEPTMDNIFLLNFREVQDYFSSDTERRAQCTPYAKSKNPTITEGYANWWLRTEITYDYSACAAYVDYLGRYIAEGQRMNATNLTIRPAMWINLD